MTDALFPALIQEEFVCSRKLPLLKPANNGAFVILAISATGPAKSVF
jgi:hypothetical protein